ncbi:MAG: hypothetical protein AVDCRST_MAG32-2489 [uncultured Nocardioides sp.]|uniref:Rhs protein n=1 Tax=uncultured Nocardioides sp. TaxID=198441 RepID=A0A6J4NNV3_9ACTN|nr:MAG: hypothetical protein AVDCRST_MAG32-2489 [uncultured Nocardioides sp.]
MSDGLLDVDAVDVVGSPYSQVADGDYSGLVQASPGADEAWKAGEAFAKGDWALGVANVAGGCAELVAMIIDPIAALGSSVAGFLLDYMPPLPQMLDALAGNPALVEGIAGTWKNVGGGLDTAAGDLQAAMQKVMASWSGMAAEAYAGAVTLLVDIMYKMGGACRAIGQGLEVASEVVKAVRGFTKALISELVGQLISWAAQVAATAGLGATWVVPRATHRIWITVTDARQVADLLVQAIRHSDLLVTTLKEVLTSKLAVGLAAYTAGLDVANG